jgi:hypothetical protein
MFIIPFTHKIVSLNQIQVHVFTILTIAGKYLWKENNSLHIINDILTPNDIYLLNKPIKHKDLYLCEVDSKKTELDNFYKWDEIDSKEEETFCWRTFYTFGQQQNDMSWLPIPSNENLEPYSCKDLFHILLKSLS